MAQVRKNIKERQIAKRARETSTLAKRDSIVPYPPNIQMFITVANSSTRLTICNIVFSSYSANFPFSDVGKWIVRTYSRLYRLSSYKRDLIY